MKKRFLKELSATLLVVMIVITPLSATLTPQKAEAALPVAVVGTILQPAVAGVLRATAAVAAFTSSLVQKELVYDTLAWLAVNALIEAMSASIVNWINSGFDGDPLFVTDIGAFLRTVELQEIIEFLGGPELGLICDPFQLQVRAALELQFRPFARDVQCSLGTITDNIQGLLDGDLTQGGLEGFIEVTTKPQNNPNGAFLIAAGELSARAANARANAQFELNIGRGFLSFRRCTTGGAPGSFRAFEDADAGNNCKIVTPGSVIEEQLNNTLDSANRRLQIADEIDEIISALIRQLIIQVLGGSSGGLSGLSSRSSSGSQSYTDQLGGYDSQTISSVRNRTVSAIDVAATDERRYLSIKQSSLSAVVRVENRILDLQSCGAALASSLDAEGAPITGGEAALRYSTNTLANVTGPLGTRLDSDIEVSNSILRELVRIQLGLSAASGPNEISALLDEFRSVNIHNEFDIVVAIQDRDRIIEDMDRVRADTDQRLVECRATLISGGTDTTIIIGGDG